MHGVAQFMAIEGRRLQFSGCYISSRHRTAGTAHDQMRVASSRSLGFTDRPVVGKPCCFDFEAVAVAAAHVP